MKRNRILILRILLLCLIVLNMVFIFHFSDESAQESSETSGKIAVPLAEAANPDLYEKTIPEQKAIINQFQLFVRKAAHMTEFASLGGLVFCFLLTWRGKVMLRYGLSILFSALYAAADEYHQNFSSSRVPQVTDALIDTAGALLLCSLILLIRYLLLRPKKIVSTVYRVPCSKLSHPVRLAVASDLHGNPFDRAVGLLRDAKPDVILIPGDLTDYEGILADDPKIFDFLRVCASIAPTFYSIGNHETGCYRHGNFFRKPKKRSIPPQFAERVSKTGAVLLRNEAVSLGELTICGLDSGFDGEINEPDAGALASFASLSGVRVLLCHHPEYYVPYISKTNIDLTVCGHAHGGHWRFFGRGVYAPDQGVFPKYTSGVLDGGRCVISRGLGDHTHIPRLFNPRELVIIDLG